MIIYMDNMSIIGRLIFHWNIVIYLLQNLIFVLNSKKSDLEPCQTMEFLQVIIDSVNMEISLLQAKIVKFITYNKFARPRKYQL